MDTNDPSQPKQEPTPDGRTMSMLVAGAANTVNHAAAAAMLGAIGGARTQQGTAWQPPEPEELQRDFPQYEIRGILGRGGMGAVYQGWQKSLDRLVAIKILPPGMDDGIAGFTERFKREAKAMAQLQHPGIVTVFDAGTTSTGLLYFVMECIAGTDVQQLVKARGRLDPAEALRITAAVCDALGYAHEHGIIHRDIKPSNIMLDARGTVKVADFGLAKTTAPDTTMLTMSNVTMGTPEFMAPESLKGVANVDHRADLYAVGVMLYQMLTGELPRGRFEPPSRAVPGLDKRLDLIVDKALQTEPAARYSTAIEVKAAIEPVTRAIARRSVGSTTSATPGKRSLFPVIAAVLVLALGAGAFFIWKRWRQSPKAEALKLAGGASSDAKSPALPTWQRIDFAKRDAESLSKWKTHSGKDGDTFHLSHDETSLVPGPAVRNGAIRATLRWNPKTLIPRVLTRSTGSLVTQYAARLWAKEVELGYYDGKDRGLKTLPLPVPPKIGDIVVLQLASIGRKHFVWVNGRLLISVEDGLSAGPGRMGIQANNAWYESMEWLPLDGIPEADALRLLGITKP